MLGRGRPLKNGRQAQKKRGPSRGETFSLFISFPALINSDRDAIRTPDVPLKSSEEFYSSSSGKAINCQEL